MLTRVLCKDIRTFGGLLTTCLPAGRNIIFVLAVQWKPRSSLKITLVKSLILTVPLTFTGSFFRLEGIWLGIALANFIGLFFADKALSKWLLDNNSELYGIKRIQAYIDDFNVLKQKIFGRK